MIRKSLRILNSAHPRPSKPYKLEIRGNRLRKPRRVQLQLKKKPQSKKIKMNGRDCYVLTTFVLCKIIKITDQNTKYLVGQKFVGQKCLNYGLVSKLLSDEKFCPSKILSTISIQKSGKNRTKLSKFRLGIEKFVRRNILSVENFIRRNFVR